MPTVGSLLIELGAGVARLQEDLGKARRQVDEFAGGVKKTFTALQTTAGAIFAGAAVNQFWTMAKAAAEMQEAFSMLDRLTRQYGTSAEGMVEKIKSSSSGLIGMKDSVSVANDALMKGFTPDQVAQLASWSVTLSKASAGTVSAAENFKMLESAMAVARERGAVQLLGVAIDLKDAFGAQAEKMDKATKAQEIFRMAARRMAEIQRTLGAETDTVADKMERLEIQFGDIKRTVGDYIIRTAAGLTATFQSVAALALGLTRVVMAPIQALMMATDYLGITKGKAEEYTADMEALGDAAEFTAQQAADNFEIMKKGFAKTAAGKVPPLRAPGGVGRLASDDYLKALMHIRKMEEEAMEARSRMSESATKAMEDYVSKGLNPIEKELDDIDRAFYETIGKQAEAWEAGAITIGVYTSRVNEATAVYQGLKDQLDAVNRSGIEMYRWQQQAIEQGNALRSMQGIEKEKWTSQTPKAQFESAMGAGDAESAINVWSEGLGEQMRLLDEAQNRIRAYQQVWSDANMSISQGMLSVGMSLYEGIGSAIASVIIGAQTAKEAFAGLAKMAIGMVVQYLAKWVISRVVMAAMGKAFQTAEIAAAEVAGSAIAAAYAPAAAMVSLATYGSNAVAAASGITATVALAEGLAIAGGAAHGGLGYVPSEQTYLLDRGERVLSPRQNEDLTEFLDGDGGRGGGVPRSGDIYLDGEKFGRWIERRGRQYGWRLATT